MSAKTKAHILVLTANLFFGAGIAAVKTITPSVMPPLAVNVLRVAIALSIFWLLFLFDQSPKTATIQRKDIKLFIICALSGVVINQILFIKGASLTSSIHTSLLGLSSPIAITIIAAVFIKEEINRYKIAGLLLGVLGAAILILLKTGNDKSSSILGDILVIINAVSYAFYLVLVKPLMARYKPLHVTRWIFTLGALIIIPLGLNDVAAIQWQQFMWYHWFSLAVVVIGGTFLSYLFILYGISKLGSSVTGTYIYTQPVFASIVSMIVFDEKLTATKIVAAIFIFAGVFLVNFNKKN